MGIDVMMVAASDKRLAGQLVARIGNGGGKLRVAMPAGRPAQLLATMEKHEHGNTVEGKALAQLRVRVDVGMEPLQPQFTHSTGLRLSLIHI